MRRQHRRFDSTNKKGDETELNKIAFVGAQSSRKTTTLMYVYSQLKIEGNSDTTILMELARDCPYPINKDGTFKTQLWMLLNQILAEQRLEEKWANVLTDRSVVDPVVYYLYLMAQKGTFTAQEKADLNFLRSIRDGWLDSHPYTTYFLFTPMPINADADRPADSKFQTDVHEFFEAYFWGKPNIIVVDQPTTEERCKFVLQKVKELIK
jgi:hypothetical protein